MKHFIFLLLMGFSFDCFAHGGELALDEDVTDVDYFVVECSDDSDRMYFSISAESASPLLSAQIAKGNFVTNITPARGSVKIMQGGGNYRIAVDKNGAGKVSYSMEYHCENNGTHSGTEITRLQ